MNQHYHLIGIGGAGMSALARVLRSRGMRVTGSDMAASHTIEALETELGETLSVGHSAGNIGAPDFVVASAAIKNDNPEMVEARRRGLPVVYRAELLGRVLDLYPVRVAVSGTHGKTTTSAMAAQMLASAGLDPTALIGADVPAWRSNTRIGGSDIVVAESCEAYGSFLELRPTHSIITNIEADHLDYYADFDAIVQAFRQFVNQTSDAVIVCADEGADKLVAEAAGAKLMTYGLTSGDLTGMTDEAGHVTAFWRGERLGDIRLQVPGRHNALNALSVVALGLRLDVQFERIAEGLQEFGGTSRRFELLGELPGGITVIDDYAHHPTEIRATLAAARSRYAGRRIVALFQPHLPSRTRDLMDDFAASFGDADQVLITDIYLAREKPMDGVTSERLAAETAKRHGADSVFYVGTLQQAGQALGEEARSGDVVITLGAGSVRAAGEALLAATREPEALARL
jgi:UDP-N-acetylmuramate--alanine ligase